MDCDEDLGLDDIDLMKFKGMRKRKAFIKKENAKILLDSTNLENEYRRTLDYCLSPPQLEVKEEDLWVHAKGVIWKNTENAINPKKLPDSPCHMSWVHLEPVGDQRDYMVALNLPTVKFMDKYNAVIEDQPSIQTEIGRRDIPYHTCASYRSISSTVHFSISVGVKASSANSPTFAMSIKAIGKYTNLPQNALHVNGKPLVYKQDYELFFGDRISLIVPPLPESPEWEYVMRNGFHEKGQYPISLGMHATLSDSKIAASSVRSLAVLLDRARDKGASHAFPRLLQAPSARSHISAVQLASQVRVLLKCPQPPPLLPSFRILQDANQADSLLSSLLAMASEGRVATASSGASSLAIDDDEISTITLEQMCTVESCLSSMAAWQEKKAAVPTCMWHPSFVHITVLLDAAVNEAARCCTLCDAAQPVSALQLCLLRLRGYAACLRYLSACVAAPEVLASMIIKEAQPLSAIAGAVMHHIIRLLRTHRKILESIKAGGRWSASEPWWSSDCSESRPSCCVCALINQVDSSLQVGMKIYSNLAVLLNPTPTVDVRNGPLVGDLLGMAHHAPVGRPLLDMLLSAMPHLDLANNKNDVAVAAHYQFLSAIAAVSAMYVSVTTTANSVANPHASDASSNTNDPELAVAVTGVRSALQGSPSGPLYRLLEFLLR